MSDKWETVGKPVASPRAGGKKVNGTTKKAAAKPMPRIEDILPPGSMQVSLETFRTPTSTGYIIVFSTFLTNPSKPPLALYISEIYTYGSIRCTVLGLGMDFPKMDFCFPPPSPTPPLSLNLLTHWNKGAGGTKVKGGWGGNQKYKTVIEPLIFLSLTPSLAAALSPLAYSSCSALGTLASQSLHSIGQ